jgi:hypothetical protein
VDYQHAYELGRKFADTLHAVDRRDEGALDLMASLFGDEARLTNASLKLGEGERVGREAIRAFWEAYQSTFQEAKTEFFELTASERGAGLFWTTSGRDAHGEPLTYDGSTLLIFNHDGLIELFRGYYDTRELTRKVGA